MSDRNDVCGQHTPGPWEFGTRDDGFSHVALATIYSLPSLPTEDGRGQRWGFISATKPCFECTAEERLANAVLMTAAPDLLEALEAVVRVADRKTVEFDLARAAIAKAKGDTP